MSIKNLKLLWLGKAKKVSVPIGGGAQGSKWIPAGECQ
jgi:hypothetical protein